VSSADAYGFVISEKWLILNKIKSRQINRNLRSSRLLKDWIWSSRSLWKGK